MAYTYAVDVYCDKCGEDIIERLKREAPEQVPEDPDDEYTFDSGDYPKKYDPENEESDSPQNCRSGSECLSNVGAGYGLFLEGRLTQDGYQYLKTMLDERGDELPPYSKEWAEFYQFTFAGWTSPEMDD